MCFVVRCNFNWFWLKVKFVPVCSTGARKAGLFCSEFFQFGNEVCFVVECNFNWFWLKVKFVPGQFYWCSKLFTDLLHLDRGT